MNKNKCLGYYASAMLAAIGSTGCSNPAHSVSPGSITPANMSRIGTVDERFQSYNVEMVEVMGGRFWKPYKDINAILDQQASRKNSGSNPAGMSPQPLSIQGAH